MIIKWIKNKIKKYKDRQLQLMAFRLADTIVKDEFLKENPEYRWMRYDRHYLVCLINKIDKERRRRLTNEIYIKMKNELK